jgi:hypothetical protein
MIHCKKRKEKGGKKKKKKNFGGHPIHRKTNENPKKLRSS